MPRGMSARVRFGELKRGCHEAQSDAGASAGDEPRSKAALETHGPQGTSRYKATGRGLDIGRQARRRKSRLEGFAPRPAGPKRPRAGESGVGSNAGPICFGGISADLRNLPFAASLVPSGPLHSSPVCLHADPHCMGTPPWEEHQTCIATASPFRRTAGVSERV